MDQTSQMVLFISCIIIYVGGISYCAYKCRDDNKQQIKDEYYDIEAPNESMAEAEGWDKFSKQYNDCINHYDIDISSEIADPNDDPTQYIGHH